MTRKEAKEITTKMSIMVLKMTKRREKKVPISPL